LAQDLVAESFILAKLELGPQATEEELDDRTEKISKAAVNRAEQIAKSVKQA